MRKWINDNPAAAAVIAGFIICVTLVLLIVRTTGSGTTAPSGAYYLDLDTGEFFIGGTRDIPPIQTPGGGSQGVRAHIYSCGDCPSGIENMTINNIESSGAFVAYLERYTDEAKELIERYRSGELPAGSPEERALAEMRALEALETGPVVRRLEGTGWIPIYSQAGLDLIDSATQACDDDGAPATNCLPH